MFNLESDDGDEEVWEAKAETRAVISDLTLPYPSFPILAVVERSSQQYQYQPLIFNTKLTRLLSVSFR